MYSKSVICIALVALSSTAWGKSALASRPKEQSDLPFPIKANAVAECGGLLTEPSGQIMYKVFDQVGSNERCVWMAAGHDAASYRVRLSSDFDWQDQYLNVAMLRHRAHELANIPTLSSEWTTVTGEALIITFHSPASSDSRGFILEYEVVSTGSTVSSNSTHSFVDDDTLFVKFPIDREEYDNNEMSTFVLPVQNNVFVQGASRLLIYKEILLEGCYDYVDVYTFNASTNRYVLRGTLCNNENDSQLFSSDDIILVAFQSDGSNTRTGFNLASAHADCNV